jgi:hypothetical protein
LGHHAQRDRSKHGARGDEGEELGHGFDLSNAVWVVAVLIA